MESDRSQQFLRQEGTMECEVMKGLLDRRRHSHDELLAANNKVAELVKEGKPLMSSATKKLPTIRHPSRWQGRGDGDRGDIGDHPDPLPWSGRLR